jgi:hypothetical protein
VKKGRKAPKAIVNWGERDDHYYEKEGSCLVSIFKECWLVNTELEMGPIPME